MGRQDIAAVSFKRSLRKTGTYMIQTLNHLFMVWKSFHICIFGYLGPRV